MANGRDYSFRWFTNTLSGKYSSLSKTKKILVCLLAGAITTCLVFSIYGAIAFAVTGTAYVFVLPFLIKAVPITATASTTTFTSGSCGTNYIMKKLGKKNFLKVVFSTEPEAKKAPEQKRLLRPSIRQIENDNNKKLRK